MFARGCTNSINNRLSKGIAFHKFRNDSSTFLLHRILLAIHFFFRRVTLFYSHSTANNNKFLRLRQYMLSAFCSMGFRMNVTIKWAIRIYRITHILLLFFILTLPLAIAFFFSTLNLSHTAAHTRTTERCEFWSVLIFYVWFIYFHRKVVWKFDLSQIINMWCLQYK